MEENLIRLILWLVFIAVWVVSGLAKKRRDDRRVAGGEDPGPEELREYFGEDEPEEPPHASKEDEFRRFLRTLTGAEEEQPGIKTETVLKPRSAEPRKVEPGPAVSPVEEEKPAPPVPRYKPARPAMMSQPFKKYARDWDKNKLRSAVIYSEILAPPRALRPYRALKRDSFRG